MLGALEDKTLFLHDLPDPGFAQQDAHFAGHGGPYPSKGPYAKRVAHIPGIGFDHFDELTAIVRRSCGRTTGTILVKKPFDSKALNQL
jgi:hypothetical protein